MKKINIVAVQPDPDGPVFGRNMDPTDFMKSQDYAHDHIKRVTKDLLVAGAASAQVAGFAATLTSGLSVSIAKGDAVDANGDCYETDAETDDGSSVVIMAAAHVSLPRIDLIVATLAIDTPVGSEFKPFRRVRTAAELEAHLDLYPSTQFETPTELHTRAVVSVITGTPNAIPVAPVAGDGQVSLWQVHVAANQVTLGGGDLTDVRTLMKSLAQVWAPLDAATAADTPNTLVKRDSNGDTRLNKVKVDSGIEFEADGSFQRSAFRREESITLLDVNDPVSFTGAASNVYQAIRRVTAGIATVNNLHAFPEFDTFVDPADFVNVSCALEVYALHVGSADKTTVQLWNATDGAELAYGDFDPALGEGWREDNPPYSAPYRVGPFSITGSGHKRLVLRGKTLNPGNGGVLKIWRVRIIINPSSLGS